MSDIMSLLGLKNDRCESGDQLSAQNSLKDNIKFLDSLLEIDFYSLTIIFFPRLFLDITIFFTFFPWQNRQFLDCQCQTLTVGQPRCEPSVLLFFLFIGPDCDCDEGHELSMVWPLFDWNPALSSRTSKREEANDFGFGFTKTIYTMTFHI